MGLKQLLGMALGKEVGLLLKDFYVAIHLLLAVVTQFLIDAMFLIFYTRKGCCLCEGLEQRLNNISLQDLDPPLTLEVVDIDSDSISEAEKNNYDLRVPIMVLSFKEQDQIIELPRISPRMKENDLFRWMQKFLNDVIY